MSFKSRACVGSSSSKQVPIPIELFQQANHGRRVPWVDLPSALVALEHTGYRRLAGPHIQYGPARRHDSVRLTGHDSAKRLGQLRNQPQVPDCQAGTQLRGTSIVSELDIGDSLRFTPLLNLPPLRSAPDKHKTKTSV